MHSVWLVTKASSPQRALSATALGGRAYPPRRPRQTFGPYARVSPETGHKCSLSSGTVLHDPVDRLAAHVRGGREVSHAQLLAGPISDLWQLLARVARLPPISGNHPFSTNLLELVAASAEASRRYNLRI